MTSRPSAWAAMIAIAPVSALIDPASATAMPSCGSVATELSAGQVREVPDVVGQFQLPLIVTNTGGEPCSLAGNLDVVLVGPDDPMWGPTYQLPQQQGDPQPTTLAPG